MKSKEEILSKIKSEIEEVTLGEVVATNIRDDQELLSDLGIDSLDYAQIFVGVEEWAETKVGEEGIDWLNIKTVKDLAELIHGSLH